jgi:membrane dipeptidase
MGENLMRIMDGVQDVARTLAHELPSRMIYDKRTDLPANWGGKDNAYLPTGVREFVRGGRKRDEL